MNGKQAKLALILPVCGFVVLLAVLTVMPFLLLFLALWRLPLILWVFMSFLFFGLGCWFVLSSTRRPLFKGAQLIGIFLTLSPTALMIASFFFSETIGP